MVKDYFVMFCEIIDIIVLNGIIIVLINYVGFGMKVFKKLIVEVF